jgi:release factor glutamine methyltransferase
MSAAANDAGPWTVARLLAWTQGHLQRGGLDSPRLCAEILLAHAMRCQRIDLYTRHDQVPGEEVLGPFRELVRQAVAGRPIAYLTGRKEFFSLPFEVCPDVFIPRPETEILVERTIDLARKAGAPLSILDLGTGSGCIIVSLAKHLPAARLLASDISEAALRVARRNAERHGVAERIEFRCGDLFEPWRAGGRDRAGATPLAFDVIVCNPPYIATTGAPVARNVRDYEPHAALFAGLDGLDVVRRVLAEAPGWLTAGGHLLLELAFDQAAAARGLLAGAPWGSIATYRDGAGHERVVHARRPAAGCARVA